MTVSKLTLAGILGTTPGSSGFRELLLAARAYGLTTGGVNADEFGLTPLGAEATGADEVARQTAHRKAIMNVAPFREFLTQYDGMKVPSTAAFAEFLVKTSKVPQEWAKDCVDHILTDARFAGFLRVLKGSEYVDLRGTAAESESIQGNPDEYDDGDVLDAALPVINIPRPSPTNGHQPDESSSSSKPKKLFIAHGKNRKPLDQLKAILDKFGVKYAVAIDEAHAGRPISAKVASLMRDECSSAIFIFTKDEQFFREDANGNREEIWRPSENVVYELGAASILYDRRIVIFKERGVSFPSDFSDLGYITFEADSLNGQTAELFGELVALDIIEIRAKS